MHPLPKQTIERFAQEFAYKDKGFTLKQINPYFESYQSGLSAPGFDGIVPKKGDHFVEVVSSMHPRNQRIALIDLCSNPPKIKNCPPQSMRENLLKCILQSDGSTPISAKLSKISISGVRDQWWVASSRLPKSPSAAITAARTLVESTCKTILDECGEIPDGSGGLQKLLKQVRKSLDLKTGRDIPKQVNEILSGLISLINGLSAISNDAGDRHGNVGGIRLEDITISSLIVHASGTAALFLAQVHLENKYIKFNNEPSREPDA